MQTSALLSHAHTLHEAMLYHLFLISLYLFPAQGPWRAQGWECFSSHPNTLSDSVPGLPAPKHTGACSDQIKNQNPFSNAQPEGV